jgi:hypothetical protein
VSVDAGGRAFPITVLTPLKPGGSPWLRFNFFFARRVPLFTRQLRKLSFIHYARWTVLRRIPQNGPPQQPEHLNHEYLLFTSNFNGTWDQYIDAFSEVVPWRMRMIWSSSFGFPGPKPAEHLKDYVRRNAFFTDHYYAAYPDASTTLVLSALALRRNFERFTRSVPADVGSEAFRRAWHAFLTDVQGDL